MDQSDIGTLRRLANAAFKVLFLAQSLPAPPDWNDFSLKEAVRKFEATIIKRALQESGGSVTTAARLLGLKHHQSLISRLDSKHSDLMSLRTEKMKRHKHLIAHPKKQKRKSFASRE